MELKISASQDSLTLQNKTHKITCETRKTLKTDRIASFKEYLSDFSCDYSLYYNESQITAWPVLASDVCNMDRNACPIAECKLEFTDEFKILTKSLNSDLEEKRFIEIINKLQIYGDFVTLINNIENMEMKKIVSMEKSKDSRGNFSYSYIVKDHGQATFCPPKVLEFTIPIFKHIQKLITFPPNFVFVYNMVGQDETKHANLVYRLEMLNVDQFVEKACTAIIDDQMKEFEAPKYWGELTKTVFTDEWKYKDVPMAFEGLPHGDNIYYKQKY